MESMAGSLTHEYRGNDLPTPCLMGSEPERKTDDLQKPDSLMEEISLFVEENCKAEILEETREIR